MQEDRIYISHLLSDEEMQGLIQKYGCGLESIEFSISENLDCLEEKIEGYHKRLEQMGNPRLILHGPFLDLNPMAYDRLVLQATRLRFEQCYQAARELGAEKIIFHTCYQPKLYLLTGWAERMADFWNSFLDGKSGIEILMENVQDPEVLPVFRVAELVKHPDFGLCFDVGHAHCYAEESVLVWAEKLAPYIRHLHVHDNDGTFDAHDRIGNGTVPVEEILALLYKQNPQLTVTIECSAYADTESSLKSVKILREKIAEKLYLCYT